MPKSERESKREPKIVQPAVNGNGHAGAICTGDKQQLQQSQRPQQQK